ncbi:gliding motility-associated C-terminal domain-containing protein [Hymenobacter sp. BT683]|uniref:Gliding motility-associated C-terminal domain-containing protein n=1 Tax=Hymenobacter jeongseonensis TaxID=2791027 RepID=A0ABS0ILX0_9BACT|nr:gliding motility-associated C-terminal domain-containing protein [Hymenobacter jeongseonensis]MBF9239372.1 gliding motility-associated C-terminal domain-containing protein [Hymenobacter jeongseonensis]
MLAELSHPASSRSNYFSLHAAERDQAEAGLPRLAASWLLTLLLLLLGGTATTAMAQGTPPPECAADEKFANTWYFGFKAGLDFNQASADALPEVLTDGAMIAPAGSGVMSDKDGKILFYSNGKTVWNGDGTVMTNGRGLAGDSTTTDGPLPIKLPDLVTSGQPTRYLLFTLNSTVGLSYSEIQIPAGGGPGIVIDSIKNRPLARGMAEKLTGVFHKNGCDIWVIAHGWGDAKSGNDNRGDAFLAYRVRQSPGYVGPVVIDAPIISTVGSLHAPSVAALGYKGQMKVTPDGQRLALARYSEAVGDSSSTVELFGFDTSTGQVSVNPQVPFVVDSGEGKYYGVSFSPGSYLYATVNNPPKLLQFDISGTGSVTKEVIPLNQNTPVNLGSMQAAPDGKIYVARNNQPALGFIPYPDSLGAKVGYADDSLQLGGRLSGLGLVNFNQSSLLRVGPSFEITGCRQISFRAPPIDFDGKTYAWKFGDGTTSTQENPVHTYARPGTYTVTLRITTACFCRESSGSILVPALPNPGRIAASQTLCAGTAADTLTSTVDASGDGGLPLVYQWQTSRDNATWTNAPGVATGPTYRPATSLPVGITYFRRRVQLLLPDQSGPYCTPSFTPSVSITVLPALTAGRIAANQTVCAGTTTAPLTSTTAAAGGTGTVAYQWESSVDNVTWTTINGARSATYAPGRLTVTTYFRRRASAGNACAPAVSNVVTITVTPALTAGSIAASQALCAGGTPVPLTSTTPATGGSGSFTYQWESSVDRTTWQTIAGATRSTYAPGRLTVTTYYRRRASSGSACTPAVSNVVTITVTPALTAGSIGANQTLCPGATPARLTSTAGASGGTGTYSYQWESGPNTSNFTPIAGATGANYSPGPLTTTTYYRRRATSGPCGPVYSPVVVLTVLPALTAGSIAANQDICTGATPAPLTSTTPARGGTGTFAYQWESSTDNVTWRTISGVTGPTYAPGRLTATTYYRRRVTSGTGTCATAFSNVLTVRVQPVVTPRVTLTAPAAQCPGIPLTFTAVATNAGTAPTFRWFVNNVSVANGPSSTFTSSTLVSGDQVRVEVTPTAGLCSTGPATATVTVTRTPTPLPTLSIGVQPGGPVCPGDALTFSIANVTNAGPAPSYQWQVDGSNVAGATTPVFTRTTLRDGQTVTLRLRTTNVCGQPVTVVSNGIAVRISPPVDVDAGPDKEILAGTSVTLEGRADGTYPVTWTPTTGLTFPGSDRLRPVASPMVTTTYTLSAGAGGCADSDQVTVRVRPAIRIPNAFTPNNDGRDDTWQIEFIEQFPNNTVSVFNRWGNQVFSADNYGRANEWRGDINGKPAPVGTYYYVVVTRGPLGKSYSGSITILY